MSIKTQLERLTGAKESLKEALEGKGVTVPSSALLEDYTALVEKIRTQESLMVTLPSAGWQGSEAPYTQTVAAPKVDATWQFDIPVTISESEQNEEIGQAAGLICMVESGEETLTFTCEEKPTVDLVLVLTRAVQATLPASGWEGEEAPYTQTVAVEGMTESWVMGPPRLLEPDQDLENERVKITAIQSGNGELIFVCDAIPEMDLTLVCSRFM